MAQGDAETPINATMLPQEVFSNDALAATNELTTNMIAMPLREARFTNNWVETNPDDGGLGWSLTFSDGNGNPWRLDLWAWDPFDYAVRQARDFSLKTDLHDCERDLILRLKTEARMRDNYYGIRVSGYDIYQFAIAQAGDSLSALEKWKMTQ